MLGLFITNILLPCVIMIVFSILFVKWIDKNNAKDQKKHNEDLKQIFKEAMKEAIEETRQ